MGVAGGLLSRATPMSPIFSLLDRNKPGTPQSRAADRLAAAAKTRGSSILLASPNPPRVDEYGARPANQELNP